MARTNSVLITGGLLAAFAVGLLAGRTISTADQRADDQALIAPQVRGDRDADGARRAFQTPRAEKARRPAPEVSDDFRYERLVLDTQGETPKACLQFTEELDASGETNYGDYLRLTPATKPVVTVNGASLCLTGLDFNKDYAVEVRTGLPGAGDARLVRGDRITVAFGDKPAYVGFAGDGVILPRLEADGLGIETVNVEKVEITVVRVSDRSLARKQIVEGGALRESDYYYVYDTESGEDVGAPIFEGVIDIESARNEAATTVFPLGAALKDLKPGAYFVRAKDVSPGADDYRTAQAWRWIMFTDMALTTYSGANGVDIFARSINTARPLAGVELSLIAINNDVLATVKTNAEGRARFDGPAVNGDYPLNPRMIMAYGPQEDFTTIDLQRAPLDLSDRNVGGRTPSAALDAYVYFDRGVYRPGEPVRLSGLLRNAAGVAAEDRPLTVTIKRPNGTQAFERRLESLAVGGFSLDYAIPTAAPRGVWRVEVAADAVGVVGTGAFSVEDFVPQRLAVTLTTDEATPIKAGDERRVDVESRFLYGAPAGGLEVEAEARLRLDPNPFPDYRAFRFGPVDGRFDERFITLPGTVTDADGKAAFPLAIDAMPVKLGAPLRADLVVGVVEPGGRVVRESARIPVRPDEAYLGVKLANDGGGVGQGEPAEIDAVIIGRDGIARAGEVEWRLVEEDYWFDWYRENGEWRWRRSYKDILIGEGRTATGEDNLARVTQTLDPGSYRIALTDPASGARSDLRFYVGWRSYAAGADTPDQASLTAPQDPVAPGARARLFLNAPYAGEAVVTVATDKVERVLRLRVEEEGREIIIDTDPAWGSGFYVMASIVTPRDVVDRPVPRRAMGVAYVPFDMEVRTLDVTVHAADMMRPRQQTEIPVTIEGARAGEPVMLTLAAVDEGILRLTKFQSPDPTDYFYGKKRLGVEVRDDYGRILHANLGAPARFGGDQLGGEGLTVVPTKSVALFSGLVEIGDNGKARVPVTLPDFNGELRLMAVAWSADKVGAAAQPMTVRDAVPALLSLPRFMAPGDRAAATLSIDNVDGAAGDYAVTFTSNGPVTLDAAETFTLAEGARVGAAFPLAAGEEGIATIAMRVEGPDDFLVTHEYDIQVRTPFFPVTNVSTAALAPGESFVATDALLAAFAPGSGSATVSFSRLRGVEPGPLLDALYRYPYGCTEQLTSSAMPLLFVDVLGGAAGRDPERAVRPRVQQAVNKILSRQGADGAFGLWREGDGYATAWLGAYVTDFFYRAKQEGYAVPDEAMTRAYSALQQLAKTNRWTAVRYQLRAVEGPNSNDTTEQLRRRASAYALYVLARAGQADLSDLRYFHDALIEATPSPLARAHVAAALALMGDNARAASGFEMARLALGFDNTGNYYQSPLRDAAGVLALAAEAGRTALVEQVAEEFDARMREPDRLHTQEKAFVLLASQALLRAAGPLTVAVDGEVVSDVAAPSFTPSRISLSGDGVRYVNQSDGPIFRTVTVSGAPAEAPPPASAGFTLTKRLATRDGRPVALDAIRQNDRMVIVLNGRPQDERLHPAIIADLLPPGFEIETVLRPEDGARRGASGPYSWIGEISRTKVAEARDDRFVAALDVRDSPFTLAYVVRAVTPGAYTLPGGVVEDMYRPGVVARTAAQSITIAAAP
ncbi:MAG: alpha-2-macroglobulin [Pseudomonadota bacterium]